MESLKSLRHSAQGQIDSLLRTAEIEASRAREQAKVDAEAIIERANREAEQTREEAAAVRASAEERVKAIEALEAQFDQFAGKLADRLGIAAEERPVEGWWQRLMGPSQK
jgi:hypothetical protein